MKRIVLLAFIVLLSGGCLYLTFRTVSFGEVRDAIFDRSSAWPYFVLSGLVMISNIVFRGFRYYHILGIHPEIGRKRSITMTGIMFLGNSILPFRAGEAIRVFLPMKFYGIPLGSSLSFHGADRLFDFAALLVLMALSLIFAGGQIAPEAATEAFDFFGSEYTFETLISLAQKSAMVFLAVGVLGVVGVSLVPEKIKRVVAALTRPLGEKWAGRFVGFVDHVHRGVTVFRSPKDFLWGAFWTFWVWYMVILNVQLLGYAFDAPLSWGQAGIITILVAGAVSLPQAPGYVGTFQLSFIIGLHTCFGVEEVTAGAIAWSAWFFQIFPVMTFGFVCMLVEGVSFGSFSEARSELESYEERESEGE